MDDLNGRVAVVTGGGSGIGRGRALGLAAAKDVVARAGAVNVLAIAARLAGFAMAAEDVEPIVVHAIRAKRFHVITHPQTRRLVEDRFRAMLEDFDLTDSGRSKQ